MSEVDPDWPAITDDSGPGQDGTIINKANVWDVIKAAINAQVYSALYPLLKPKDAIEEVAGARGTLASLAARLGVSLNPDGTLKTQAHLASGADVASIVHGGNWIYNDDLLIWAGGDAGAPTGYTLTGAGAAVARTGTGLGDTSTKVGPFSAKLTRAAADAQLAQNLMNAASFAASGQHFKTTGKFGFGCWVKTSLPNAARVVFGDGATITASEYHPGDGTWQWLSGVHTVSGAASSLYAAVQMNNSAGACYLSGMTAVPGNIAPGGWIPCAKAYDVVTFQKHGVIAAASDQGRFVAGRPFLVKYVHLSILGAGPTGQPIIVQLGHFAGGFQGVFATRPQIAIGSGSGGAAPDGTYRWRCFTAGHGEDANSCLMNYSIDQVGTGGVAGSDLAVSVRCLQYARPQESLLGPTDF
jgi:hypothetical protein